MKRAVLPFLSSLLACAAVSQTPPIKPQTPDVKIPPPVTLPAPPEVAGAQPLSVEEAIAIALRQHASITVARANVDAAAGRTQQTRSGLLPQFSATGSVSDQETLRGAQQGTPNRFNLGVGVDQLIFDFGRTRNQVRQQGALEDAQREVLNATEQEVALQTRLAFHNYAESLRLVAVSDQNVANRQRQLAQAEARVESGLGNPADLVRAKTGLAEAVLSLETARQSALNDRVALAERLGIDPRTPVTPTVSEALPAGVSAEEVNNLVMQALRDRPEIREAQLRVTAAGLGVAVARLGNAPRVSLSADLNARGVNDPFATSTGALGLNISWTFGDGGLTAGRTREARAQQEIARANLDDLTRQIVSDVSNAYVELVTALQRLETSEVQLANAAELLRISEGRYSGEIGTFLEVTDAQSSLFSAERNVLTARADVNRARARLDRAIGVGASP